MQQKTKLFPERRLDTIKILYLALALLKYSQNHFRPQKLSAKPGPQNALYFIFEHIKITDEQKDHNILNQLFPYECSVSSLKYFYIPSVGSKFLLGTAN